MRTSTWHFNREILVGECGALLLANAAAFVLAGRVRDPAVIASAAVGATLVGGGLSWLAARIYDQIKIRGLKPRHVASDIGYFAPAAIVFGLGVYDPAIFYLTSYLVGRGAPAQAAIAIGQIGAFSLFLLCLNGYRLSLFRIKGKLL